MTDDVNPKPKAASKASKQKTSTGLTNARKKKSQLIKERHPSLTKALKPRGKRGSPRGHVGTPPFVATEEMRRRVYDFMLVGTPHRVISEFLGISEDTLQKYFRSEIERTLTVVNSQVAKSLVNRALAGDQKAAEFWLRTRAGFKNAVEGSGEKNDESIEVSGGLPD
jgi:hypothetical protein